MSVFPVPINIWAGKALSFKQTFLLLKLQYCCIFIKSGTHLLSLNRHIFYLEDFFNISTGGVCKECRLEILLNKYGYAIAFNDNINHFPNPHQFRNKLDFLAFFPKHCFLLKKFKTILVILINWPYLKKSDKNTSTNYHMRFKRFCIAWELKKDKFAISFDDFCV